MPSPLLVKGEFWEGSNFFCIGRPTGANGNVIVRADVTDYSVSIYDESDGDAVVYSATAQPAADIMTVTVTQDGFWTIDPDGYSMLFYARAALWTTPHQGGKTYRVEILLNTTTASYAPHGWGIVPCMYQAYCRPLVAA